MGQIGDVFRPIDRFERDAFVSGREHSFVKRNAFKLGLDKPVPIAITNRRKFCQQSVCCRVLFQSDS